MKYRDPSSMGRKPIKLPRLRVKALVHDLDLKSYLLDLRFRSIDGGLGKLQVSRASIKVPDEVVGKLLDVGAIVPDDRKEATEFVREALRRSAAHRYAITRRGGWHGNSFVTNTGTIGEERKILCFSGSPQADPSIGLKKGKLEAWREGLRKPCAASSFLTFALAVGFSGPLLDLIGQDEGVIFNFFGPSSSGKSLAARTLHSQAGRARKSDLATYGITDRGAEELCFALNDWAVVFDEEGRAKGARNRGGSGFGVSRS